MTKNIKKCERKKGEKTNIGQKNSFRKIEKTGIKVQKEDNKGEKRGQKRRK